MAEPTVDQRSPTTRRRARDTALPSLRERLPWTSPLLVLGGAVLLVVAGQLVEDLADTPPLQMLVPTTAPGRWTLIVAIVYMLVVSMGVDRYVQRSLATIDAVVRAPADRFAELAVQMGRPSFRVDLVLLAASAVVVAINYVYYGTALPIDDQVERTPVFLPGGIGAPIVLVAYTLVGWAVLTLVYTTVRRAVAIGRLSRERLEIDVFDTSNLLPLGNIALATALAPAGVLVIMLVGFGRPTQAVSWSLLILVTLASLIGLLLPLRGIHRQMETAKEAALGSLNAQLRTIYEQIGGSMPTAAAQASLFNDRTSTLVNLRRTVGEMTTWPFRDTLAFGRALLIATAPLIYTILNELAKRFVIGP